MNKRINVKAVKYEGNSLLFEIDESINGLIPKEQILVDSDNFAFIYLLENENDYTYIVLPEQIWPEINSAREQNLSILLTCNGEELELLSFWDELEFIISNIKGNSNYGHEMVGKVEQIFIK